jgi:hypothetical protein
MLVVGEVEVGSAEDAAPHRADVAEATGHGPGVDAPDAHDAVGDELVVEAALGAVVRHDAAGVAHDEARDPDATGLGIFVVDARVADVRGRHDDDLPGVRRVGQGLLVAGHAGREDGLAERAPDGAVGAPDVAGPVFEHEDGPGGGGRVSQWSALLWWCRPRGPWS